VVQSGFLGDVVLTTPLLAALRAVARPRRLTVVVRPDAVPLVAHHPMVDAVVVDDKRGADRGFGGAVATARRLRRLRIDIAVAAHKSLRTAVVLALAGVRRRIGFAGAPGAWLYTRRVVRDVRRHEVERILGLITGIGAAVDDYVAPPSLRAGPAGEAAAARLLARHGVDDGRPLYGLCPGSVWATKRWRPEGFAAVARGLAGREGAAVLVLGGAADEATAAAVARGAGAGVIDLAGRTDLDTLIALMARLRAVVTNDSAPMHVAAASGVPVVAVFCATTPAQGYGPYGARATVVEADLACRPCGRHGGRRCPRRTEDCIRLVEANEVLRAVERLVPAGRVRAAPVCVV
jgi:heptosyltransferase-2